MDIKPLTPKEIIENRFSPRTVSIVNDFLEENFILGKKILLTFEEFCRGWEDYNNDYEELIKKEYKTIGKLYSLYGWSVTYEENGIVFEHI